MENTLYVNNVLDNDFEELVTEKIQSLKSRYSEDVLRKISVEEVLKVSQTLLETKPKSKMRIHKKQLLQYLDYVNSHRAEKLTQKEIDAVKQKYVFQSNYLLESNGYVHKDLWIFSTFFGLIMDLILFFIGISKYYYFIPICAFISFVRSYRRELKAKKEGKLLNF